MAGDEVVQQVTGAPVGFAGPVGLPKKIRMVAMTSPFGILTNFVVGANKPMLTSSVSTGTEMWI